jgi:hypothetical protein
MKLNVNEVIKGMDGKAIETPKTFKDGKVETVENLTVKKILLETLLQTTEQDRNVSGTEKFERYALASKINEGGEIDFTVEEAAKIKARVGEICTPLVLGYIWNRMEEKDKKSKGK